MEAPNWRDGRGPSLVQEIEKAIDQFRANEDYESRHGKLNQTIGHLKAIHEHGSALLSAIDALSPVGKASIHEVGMKRGVSTGRYELHKIAEALTGMPEFAADAAELLEQMHSPLPDQGQGTGSAMGRDSDLRAIRAEHGRGAAFAFRSPKDKLGVAVVEAFLRHERDFDPIARGAGAALELLLHRVWEEVRPGEPANWTRIVRARKAIGDLVRRRLASEAVWRRVQEKRNASSRDSKRPLP